MAAADYAKRPRREPGRPATRPARDAGRGPAFSWGSFVSGMVVGIALTLTGVLLPWSLRDETREPAPSAAGQGLPPGTGVAEAAENGAEGASPAERPEEELGARFTFWDELPRERSEPPRSPEQGSDARAGTGTASPGGSEITGEGVEYVLQAGSFSRAEDAERLRSALGEIGMEAETARVTLPGGATRHRVLVGPYADRRELGRAQSRLRRQDIDPLPLRRSPAG